MKTYSANYGYSRYHGGIRRRNKDKGIEPQLNYVPLSEIHIDLEEIQQTKE